MTVLLLGNPDAKAAVSLTSQIRQVTFWIDYIPSDQAIQQGRSESHGPAQPLSAPDLGDWSISGSTTSAPFTYSSTLTNSPTGATLQNYLTGGFMDHFSPLGKTTYSTMGETKLTIHLDQQMTVHEVFFNFGGASQVTQPFSGPGFHDFIPGGTSRDGIADPGDYTLDFTAGLGGSYFDTITFTNTPEPTSTLLVPLSIFFFSRRSSRSHTGRSTCAVRACR